MNDDGLTTLFFPMYRKKFRNKIVDRFYSISFFYIGVNPFFEYVHLCNINAMQD